MVEFETTSRFLTGRTVAVSALIGGWLIMAVLVLSGCNGDAPTQPGLDVPLLRTIPVAGTQDFDPDDPIQMMFNEPVDTAQFHEWFYCLDSISHDALEDSLEHGMMGMDGMHFDSTMFYGRMHDRGVDGEFSWNMDGDSCVFIPDTALAGNTEYVLRFRSGIRNHNGGRMHHMGGFLSEDVTIRFRTR